MKKRNDMSGWGYIFFCFYVTACMMIFYRNTLFLMIEGLSLQQSLRVFLIGTAVLTALGTALTFRKRRSNLDGYANAILPLALYAYVSYASRGSMPAVLWAALAVGLALCGGLGFLFWLDRDHKKPEWAKIWLLFRMRIVLAFVLGSVLFVASLLSLLQHGNVLTRSEVAAAPAPAYEMSTDALKPEMEEIMALLYKEDRTLSESHALLQKVANVETAFWGLPYELTVEISPLDGDTLGQYNHLNHQIQINESIFLEWSERTLLETILHECYHAVQHARVDAYNQVDDSLRAARFFQREYIWSYEIEHYSTDPETYFYLQLEEDADIYADNRIPDYLRVLAEPEDPELP